MRRGPQGVPCDVNAVQTQPVQDAGPTFKDKSLKECNYE